MRRPKDPRIHALKSGEYVKQAKLDALLLGAES